MDSISIRARSRLRAAVLFAACSSAAIAPVLFATAAAADSLPYLVASRVATANAGTCPQDTLASLAVPLVVDTPEIARLTRASGTATLRVDLSPEGYLVGTSVLTSTRNRWLDRAALDTIRQARFQSEVRACRHVSGSYLVDVVFPQD